jgi:peptidoglycan hydrolase-like protein with peptidoglycan-binding domain
VPDQSSGGGSVSSAGSITSTATQVSTTATTASDADMVALQARLHGLIVTLQALKAQGIANLNANAVMNANANASFKRNLAVNATGDDVQVLQAWLNSHGHVVAVSGPGSPGNETKTFGGLTRRALAQFQVKAGISPALGNFGPLTRAYIQTNY